MSLILDGSAGVSFPSGSGTQAAQSKVLQVVQGTYTTQTSIASTSYTDTGLTATITPLFSTSKILVLISLQSRLTITTDQVFMFTNMVRGSTQIYTEERASGMLGANNGSVLGIHATSCFNYLDSPATTSATTYKMQACLSTTANSASLLINNAVTTGNAISTITLMEIAV
jgi:hypothetical protein